MKKGIVIAGFAGIGKSMLASKYKNVVDLEIMEFKWDYKEKIADIEKKKGNSNKTRKEEWPENYIDAIQNATTNYDITLISTDDEILNELEKKEIEYILCYPTLECKNEYLDRYRKRGNTEAFIQRVAETFEDLIKGLQKYKAKKIVLKNNETLESKLNQATKVKEDDTLEER